MSSHDTHCFVAISYGKTDAEHELIRGWIDEVMRPVAERLKLQLEVAAATTAPSAITPEMREHLAFDKLAFFDLGGVSPSDPPNPNVMYELGLRHAFDLPSVILAWDEQNLPFDIGEQRALLSVRRDVSTLKWHRDALHGFAEAALNGTFFRPMNAVRTSRIAHEVVEKSDNAAIVALGEEVKRIREMLQQQLLPDGNLRIVWPGRATLEDIRNRAALNAVIEGLTNKQPKTLVEALADMGYHLSPGTVDVEHANPNRSRGVTPIISSPKVKPTEREGDTPDENKI